MDYLLANPTMGIRKMVEFIRIASNPIWVAFQLQHKALESARKHPQRRAILLSVAETLREIGQRLVSSLYKLETEFADKKGHMHALNQPLAKTLLLYPELMLCPEQRYMERNKGPTVLAAQLNDRYRRIPAVELETTQKQNTAKIGWIDLLHTLKQT